MSPLCFNPRARVGRDLDSLRRVNGELVSIHAPAWGATKKGAKIKRAMISFNPRARVGRDSRWCEIVNDSNSFNPRARVGRDEQLHYSSWLSISFNPRARVGRDTDNSILRVELNQFQSTRPRGARPGMSS